MSRRIRYFIVIILVLVFGYQSLASIYRWEDSTADHQWATLGNWTVTTYYTDPGYVPTVLPGSSDTVVLANGDLTNGSVLNSGTNIVNKVYVGDGLYYDLRSSGMLTVNTGAFLATAQNFRVGGFTSAAVGIVNIDGGSLNVGTDLQVGAGSAGSGGAKSFFYMNSGTVNVQGKIEISYLHNCDGHLQLDGGVINTGDLWMQVRGYPGTMDITGGKMVIAAPTLGTEQIQAYINNDWITAYNGTGTVILKELGGTVVELTAIPEPITVALLGFGGLVLLRKRSYLL